MFTRNERVGIAHYEQVRYRLTVLPKVFLKFEIPLVCRTETLQSSNLSIQSKYMSFYKMTWGTTLKVKEWCLIVPSRSWYLTF